MIKKIIATLLSVTMVFGTSLCANAAEANSDEAASHTTIKLGDADGDGVINAVDASIALSNYARYATSKDKPTEYELATQDVNKDGAVNAVDASIILSYYAYTSVGGKLSFPEYLKNPNADPKATTTTTTVTTTAKTTTTTAKPATTTTTVKTTTTTAKPVSTTTTTKVTTTTAKPVSTTTTTKVTTTTAKPVSSTTTTTSAVTTTTTKPTEASGLSGKLIPVENGRKDMPVIKGVSLAGNVAGTADYNSKEPSVEDIRCIFELNEWIAPTIDSDTKSGFKLYILEHKGGQNSYDKAVFSEEMQGFVTVIPLDHDAESNNWGEFYLSPEGVEPGYYDLYFTYDGSPIAKLYTRFYKEDELSGRSDTELRRLVSGSKAPETTPV